MTQRLHAGSASHHAAPAAVRARLQHVRARSAEPTVLQYVAHRLQLWWQRHGGGHKRHGDPGPAVGQRRLPGALLPHMVDAMARRGHRVANVAVPPTRICRLLLRVLQPIITLPDSTWHRWRLLYSGQKNWFVLQLLEQDLGTGVLAFSDRCELQLTAKDGEHARFP